MKAASAALYKNGGISRHFFYFKTNGEVPMKRHIFLNPNLQNLSFSLVIVLGVVFSSVAFAADQDVIAEVDGLSITHADLEAEIQKAPPEVRNGLLFRKEGIAKLADNLLIRRILAKQAEEGGLGKQPVTEAGIRLAKEKILSDAQLARFDAANKPSLEVLDKRARDVYKAEPKRFEIGEEVRVSHILVPTGVDAKLKAEAILTEIKAGKSFEELAKEKSADPGSADKGGDLGLFGRGRMVKAFEDTAFALKTGQLSNPVETQFGWHILKLTERKEARIRAYDDVKDTLMQEIAQKMTNDARAWLVQQIMNKAKSNPVALDSFIASQKPKD